MTSPITYDDIKTLAVKLGRPTSTLIALAPGNDPFYCAPARQALARWFADEVWPLLDPDADSVHVRRLHYLVVNQPLDRRPAKLDGTAFENTVKDWEYLSAASLAARELGLVDSDRFVDRRAGEPTFVYIPDDEESEAEVIVTGDAIERPFPEQVPRYTPRYYTFPPLPALSVLPPEIVEPYAIEVWAEKSTMNDVLVPLARRLNVTVVTGVGELSHTHCNKLVKRVLEHGRKTRILYSPTSTQPATACRSLSPARSNTSCAATAMKTSISGSTRWCSPPPKWSGTACREFRSRNPTSARATSRPATARERPSLMRSRRSIPANWHAS
jgi:hypothetical protein